MFVQDAAAQAVYPDITVVFDDPLTPGNTLVAFLWARTVSAPGSLPQSGWTPVPSSAGIHLGTPGNNLYAYYRLVDVTDTDEVVLLGIGGGGWAHVSEYSGLDDLTEVLDPDALSPVGTLELGPFVGSAGTIVGAFLVGGSGAAGGNTLPDMSIDAPGVELFYHDSDSESDPDTTSGTAPTVLIGYIGDEASLTASLELGPFVSGPWGGIGLYFSSTPPDPDDPPVDPGYEPPDPGRAIVEMYLHDEDATRWGTATWGDNPPTGTTGIWSGAGWQDVTPQSVNAHIIWGSRRPERGILSVQDPASWMLTTYDPLRVLDPGNPDSPYAPQLVAGVPIRIRNELSGVVVRTGIVERIAYRYKAPEYRGQILATSTIAIAHKADVPEDTILPDDLRGRIQDATTAAGIAIGGIPLLGSDDSYPEVPLSPRIEGKASLWDHISKGGQEVHWVMYEDAAGTLQARPWGGPLDRGSEITYENLEDLEASSSDDGAYSVVYVTNEDGSAEIERVAAPLPRYGRVPYTRRETTIDPELWADAVLADRSWPGVLWTPGTVWCFDAADVEFMATLETMERVTITVPGVVSVSGRLLGMELWVQAVTETENRWLFLPRIATDGSTAIGSVLLVSDDDGSYLLSDDDGSYMEPDDG